VFCAALVAGALGAAATWPGFDPERIAVTGNHRVTRNEILIEAAIAPHVSIWLQNTGAMAARIERIPFVAWAGVQRIPPASLRIAIEERIPYAQVRSGQSAAIVDQTLRALSAAEDDAMAPVFVLQPGVHLTPGTFIRAASALELRDVYQAMREREFVPVELALDRFGGLVVTLRGGMRLLLGSENDLDQKLTLAKAIEAQVASRQPQLTTIDLRAPAAPVVVYR